ncbi:hypothetical protein IscW_ISCW015600 [Ixodes scapularis]|uniref:Uncharacterized protein n=1 Tax=Ixodes scapularis TaxID=6945 RepID=B7P3X4_IXOSC|nr:hypothetical protein IscW_ISCW015600 [Ixodes scapularis]|eukprot:XP_002404772.1 hypothetical protein IscW_ISCW015600 [Ixodes scapularis]
MVYKHDCPTKKKLGLLECTTFSRRYIQMQYFGRKTLKEQSMSKTAYAFCHWTIMCPQRKGNLVYSPNQAGCPLIPSPNQIFVRHYLISEALSY